MRLTRLLCALLLLAGTAQAGMSNLGSSYLASYDGGAGSTFTPNSTSLATMGGLAGTITPHRTGNIRICAFGYMTNTALLTGEGIINFRLGYGTGAAPSANAALTGTQIGPSLKATLFLAALVAANINVTLDSCAIVTGLTIGTAYWLDVCGEANVNTTNTWHGAISANEI